MLAPFRDSRGCSWYDWLAGEVRDLPAEAGILDLACGDGYLMSLLASRGGRRLVGIDRSAEELAAARARLGGGGPVGCCVIALLAGRGGRRLVGIDRSAEELAAARARLGAGVELYCCDASALPFP